MVKFLSKIVFVPIEKLKVDGINPNFVPTDLQRSLEDHVADKFYGAIVVNKDNWVVDGKHRFEALKKAGAKKIPVIYDHELDDKQSKVEMIRFNRERGRLMPNEVAAVFGELEYSVPELAEATAMSEFEVESFLMIDKLNEEYTEKRKNDFLLVGWEYVMRSVSKVSQKLGTVREIYTIGRGGLIPARLIADRCNCHKIYVDEEPPDGAILVDDVWDSGKTLEKYPHCKRVVLYAKDTVPDDVIYAEPFESFLIFPWERIEYQDLMKS